MVHTVGLMVAVGLVGGVASGLVGIGGGVVIVPLLVYLFGFTQHQAQGTTLALLLPPVGALAVWAYYQKSYVDVRAAALLCVGFVLGAWLGAKLATNMSTLMLQRVFGTAIVLIGLRMLLVR